MEPIKLTENLEFDVIYADGTKKRVREGILMEREGDNLTMHLGDSRVSTLFGTIEALLEAVYESGLGELFTKYMDSQHKEDEE